MKKRVLAALLAVLLAALSFAGCGSPSEITTGETGVVKDTEFENVYIDGLTIEEFNALGFAFGDSLNIRFDNGQTLEDVPYYSGYYVPVGELLACGYPGYPHVVIARNYGASTWEEFGMTDDSKITVTLNEKLEIVKIHQDFDVAQ
jgi:hypothetical protein